MKFVGEVLECCDKFQILIVVITNDQVRYDNVKVKGILFETRKTKLHLKLTYRVETSAE